MYQRILVPVDGSATSQSALKEVARFVKTCPDAEVCLVHVIHLMQASAEISEFASNIKPIKDVEESLRIEGKKILELALQSASAMGFTPKTELLETYTSNSAEVIVEKAKAWPCDLIIMGTHGYGGFTHLLLGSVAEGVVRHAPVPVLLVRIQA